MNDEPIEAVVARVKERVKQFPPGRIDDVDDVRLAREVGRLNSAMEARKVWQAVAEEERDEARAEVEQLQDAAVGLVNQIRWAEERCDTAWKERNEARADNAALIERIGHEGSCSLLFDDGDDLLCDCIQSIAHPGAELLARIERLRAYVLALEERYWNLNQDAMRDEYLQPGDLGGEA